MPLDTLPASSEMVPVGAIEVRQPLRMPWRRIASRTGASSAATLGLVGEALGVVQREGALLGSELGAGDVGGVLDGRHPARGKRAASGVP